MSTQMASTRVVPLIRRPIFWPGVSTLRGGEREARISMYETVRQFGLQVRFRGREPAGAAFQVEGVPWTQESRRPCVDERPMGDAVPTK